MLMRTLVPCPPPVTWKTAEGRSLFLSPFTGGGCQRKTWGHAQGAQPGEPGAAREFPSPSSGHIRFQNVFRSVL